MKRVREKCVFAWGFPSEQCRWHYSSDKLYRFVLIQSGKETQKKWLIPTVKERM